MSRVGKNPIQVPAGVKISEAKGTVTIEGPKGQLTVKLLSGLKLEQTEQKLEVALTRDLPEYRSRHGLVRSLINNAVLGVTDGFSRQLEVHGVGYRASLSGNKLTLNVGYSHPIEYQLPDGVEARVEENVITLSGIDKQLVGQAAAHIREFRKPEPYKGKGIRYSDEYVRRKAGKTAAGAGAES